MLGNCFLSLSLGFVFVSQEAGVEDTMYLDRMVEYFL